MDTPQWPKFQVLKADTMAELRRETKKWLKNGYKIHGAIKCSDGFAVMVWREDEDEKVPEVQKRSSAIKPFRW